MGLFQKEELPSRCPYCGSKNIVTDKEKLVQPLSDSPLGTGLRLGVPGAVHCSCRDCHKKVVLMRSR